MDDRMRHMAEPGADGKRSLASTHDHQIGFGRGIHQLRPGGSHHYSGLCGDLLEALPPRFHDLLQSLHDPSGEFISQTRIGGLCGRVGRRQRPGVQNPEPAVTPRCLTEAEFQEGLVVFRTSDVDTEKQLSRRMLDERLLLPSGGLPTADENDGAGEAAATGSDVVPMTKPVKRSSPWDPSTSRSVLPGVPASASRALEARPAPLTFSALTVRPGCALSASAVATSSSPSYLEEALGFVG